MIPESDYQTSYHVALLSIRILAGVLFTAQGYDKLFKLGIAKVMEPFLVSLNRIRISRQLLYFAILISSTIEFCGGILLVTGLIRDYAIYLMLLNMLLVAIGFCMIRPLWDLQHYFPRFILLVGLLLLPHGWDIWSLDSLLF